MTLSSMAVGAPPLKQVPLTQVPLKQVRLTDEFWAPKIQTNRTVTIPHNFQGCEQTGRIANFARAAGLEPGGHQGAFFNDSDVYKVIEAASYALAAHPDPKLDAYLDGVINLIAAAQKPDGYLYTFHELNGMDRRFSNLKDQHELYCAGHLIEAAVAHHAATGKTKLLNVAIKLANLLDATFGPDKRHEVDGHEEIELALFKLAQATGQQKYRALGEFFVKLRGHDDGRKRFGGYYQDQEPLTQATAVAGHAVRQMYLMCAATDLARHDHDEQYASAVDRLWEDMTHGKLYITGGVGARHEGEAFGEPFELPNESAYAETCAAIGNALWSQRMNLLHADGKYADAVEQATYNGILSGVSIRGDAFFYVNPLASEGKHHRQAWYDCACCPPNIARFIASLPSRAYATSADEIYVNLYAAGEATIELMGQTVRVKQVTKYPWDGKVNIMITPQRPATFALKVRVPGWCRQIVGLEGAAKPQAGYVEVRRTWKGGDSIEFELRMPIERVKSNPRVKDNVGRVALRRGPIVYCAEAVDNGGRVMNLFLPPDATLTAEHRADLLGGVTVLTGAAMVAQPNRPAKQVKFTAVPYYAWDNRDPGEMEVWLAEDPAKAQVADVH
jgi:DUF1680 family protein